jgi:hypothetical protein
MFYRIQSIFSGRPWEIIINRSIKKINLGSKLEAFIYFRHHRKMVKKNLTSFILGTSAGMI